MSLDELVKILALLQHRLHQLDLLFDHDVDFARLFSRRLDLIFMDGLRYISPNPSTATEVEAVELSLVFLVFAFVERKFEVFRFLEELEALVWASVFFIVQVLLAQKRKLVLEHLELLLPTHVAGSHLVILVVAVHKVNDVWATHILRLLLRHRRQEEVLLLVCFLHVMVRADQALLDLLLDLELVFNDWNVLLRGLRKVNELKFFF